MSGLGNATFVQVGRLLENRRRRQPLDATWIHPENYEAAKKLLEKLGIDPATVAGGASAARIRELVAPLDRAALAAELGIGQLALDDMIEALCRPGRDPREDLPPPIFRKDVVKFEDLQAGMELRGTVLNVVDFGAFVDVGLSDSGLVHISQLSAGYVRDPHDVVAVGDQVRAWVSSIDKDRRRVALTMIAPGTERPKPDKSRGAAAAADRTAHSKPQPQAQAAPEGRTQRAPKDRPRRHRAAPASRARDRRGPPQRQPRTGCVREASAETTGPDHEGDGGRQGLSPLLRRLAAVSQKKKEHERDEPQPGDQSEPPGNSNGTTQLVKSQESRVESRSTSGS